MLYSDPNAFERLTDKLKAVQVRQSVLLIFQAAEYMAEGNWSDALSKIDSYRLLARGSKFEDNQALQKEVSLMESFCYFQIKNQAKAEQIILNLLSDLEPSQLDLSSQSQSSISQSQRSQKSQKIINYRSLSIRTHTFAATIIISSSQTELDYKEIKAKLIALLKPQQMRLFLPEVLGTLTGCKYFQPLISLKEIPGPPSVVLAKKLQIVADWKFLAGLREQALQFKKRAQKLWQILNCHNQFLECQNEFKDIESKHKSQYMLKLSRTKVFVDGLLKLQQPNPANNKQTLLKWKIPVLIDEILPPPSDPKLKKKQSVPGQSKLSKQEEKKQTLKDIIGMCSRFYNSYKSQIGSEATNLILNSKFMEEEIKLIRKKLAILVKLKTVRLRETWKKLKLKAFPEEPVLASAVLKGKQTVYY